MHHAGRCVGGGGGSGLSRLPLLGSAHATCLRPRPPSSAGARGAHPTRHTRTEQRPGLLQRRAPPARPPARVVPSPAQQTTHTRPAFADQELEPCTFLSSAEPCLLRQARARQNSVALLFALEGTQLTMRLTLNSRDLLTPVSWN